MNYLLDTHVWIWANAAPDQLTRKQRNLLASPPENASFLLSSISLWEICKLAEKGRIDFFEDLEQWVESALDMPNLKVVPLDFRIFFKSTTLPQPFHNDPADQMIVATARFHDATILTQDQQMLDYRFVKTL